MIFVPLLHYFKNKNSFSGNEDGMRYLLTPGKRKVPDPEGGEGAEKEESILTVDVWPDPWALEFTDPGGLPSLRRGPGCGSQISGRDLRSRPGALEAAPLSAGL